MSAPAIPGNRTRPENLLFRSRLEICRILQLLAQEQSPITAESGTGQPFASHILAVDPGGNRFTVACSAGQPVSALVPTSPAVEFTCTDQHGLHFSFAASFAEEIQFGGQPAIQFALPNMVLLHNQREHPRIPAPADLSLRCIADEAGVIPFESHIVDISHDGLGCLIYSRDINLDVGSVLRGCRVILPNGDAALVDLEVRHVATATLPDGRTVHRAGLRFVQRREEISRLVDLYIQDLGKT